MAWDITEVATHSYDHYHMSKAEVDQKCAVHMGVMGSYFFDYHIVYTLVVGGS